MSMFLCPLCGKQNSIKKYQSENFDDDVEIFHNASLGYRKGFEKIMGYDLSEFPELREKLGNRVNIIANFLGLQEETDTRIKTLEKRVEVEKSRRISAEEELEEEDLGLMLRKVNSTLGQEYTGLHSAVDELITRAKSVNNENRKLRAENQSLQSRYIDLKKAYTSLESQRDLVDKENYDLHTNINQWSNAYRNLEAQKNQEITRLLKALTSERNRRNSLEDELEELDLNVLLSRVNNAIGIQHTNLHSAINEIIHDLHSYKREIDGALEFINTGLPEEYDEFYDLGEALEAFYQYYEDQIEELSDD